MKIAFGFFLRLFACFVGAKFFLRFLGVESRLSLVGLTALLTANIYWFDFLEYRDRLYLRSLAQEGPGSEETAGERSSPKISQPQV
jgi:hypothetical protein